MFFQQSLKRRRRGPRGDADQNSLMAFLNVASAVVLAVVFDLPATVQPPVARGERRERRGRVRTGESERGVEVVRGFMARFLGE